MTDTIARLIEVEGLPQSYRETVECHWVGLAARISALRAVKGRQIIVSINGAQGTGKTTLCLFLEALLAEDHAQRAVTISLDDFYLTKADRAALASTAHPLFATRGVPGTHDLALAAMSFADLAGSTGTAQLPRFDKSRDDRALSALWPRVTLPVDVILFEGWCVGACAQPAEALATPINALEAEEDTDGLWRQAVNEALCNHYPALCTPIDSLIMLRAPNFEAVHRWRQTQEAKLRAKTGRGMSEADVTRFIAHYERLTRHMLDTMPAMADFVFELAEDQTVILAR